jgi:hypothetical protein
MTKHLFLVFTRPTPGREAEFNDWYDNEHLGDVLRVPGVTAAQRFRVAPQFTTPDMLHGYLAIYEIEGDDPQAALAAISGAANTDAMHISDALDTAAALTFLAKPISRRVSEEPAGG